MLMYEHLVLVRDPHTQAILQRADDLTQPFDGACVHDPHGSAYELHGRDVVPQLRQVRAHEHVVHKPQQCRCVGWRIEVAKQECC